jgi:HEPN domain-containing protein
MAERAPDSVAAWLHKARQDLAAASVLAGSPERLAGPVLFHAQQAAEKSIKAFLVLKGYPFPKTHDLTELLNRAADFEPRFAEWHDRVGPLTPYGAEFRYPMAVPLNPTIEEARAAVQTVQALHEFACSLLPKA